MTTPKARGDAGLVVCAGKRDGGATATRLWGTETYSYDPLNNLRTRVGNGQN
ncbi:MAG: hypothetical protein KGJ32_03145 [Xanthomonadaceae bacterium]|nr:hypothetical protein [Xanthomonadaceae bacterium]